MKSLGRITITILAWLSAIACIATVVLCVHSFFGAHVFMLDSADSNNQQTLSISAGWDKCRLVLCCQKLEFTGFQVAKDGWASSYEDHPNIVTQWFWWINTSQIPQDSLAKQAQTWTLGFPLPALTILTAILPGILFIKRSSAKKKKNAAQCPRCGHHLPHAAAACPKCSNMPPGMKIESPYLKAKMPPRAGPTAGN